MVVKYRTKSIRNANRIEDYFIENDVTQDVTQGVTQDVTQEDNLDKWIEYQVAVFPNITTDELAAQAGVSSRTIKRRITKMTHVQFVGSGYSGHWEVKPK